MFKKTFVKTLNRLKQYRKTAVNRSTGVYVGWVWSTRPIDDVYRLVQEYPEAVNKHLHKDFFDCSLGTVHIRNSVVRSGNTIETAVFLAACRMYCIHKGKYGYFVYSSEPLSERSIERAISEVTANKVES